MSNDTNTNSGDRAASFFSMNGWWYASAALILAVVLGIIALLLLPGDGDTDARGDDTAPTGPPPLSSPAPSSDSGSSTGWADLGCNGTEGDSKTPSLAPEATWEPVGVMSAPTSEEYGPTQVDGFVRTCYQHTPTGAVFAAINLMTSFAAAPESELRAVTEASMTPGPFRDETLSSPRGELGWQISAFDVQSCTPERCNVAVVVSLAGGLAQVNSPMVWTDGDWKLDGQTNAGGSSVESVPPGYVVWGA